MAKSQASGGTDPKSSPQGPILRAGLKKLLLPAKRDQRSVWAQAKGISGVCWVHSVSWKGMLMRSRERRSSMSRDLWLSLSGHCVLGNHWSWESAGRRHSCPTYSWETARGWISSSQVLFLAANSVWRQRAKVDSLRSNLHLPMPSEPYMSPWQHLLEGH